MPLDENALRRPGFIEGTRVTLGDGREWTLPTAMFNVAGPGDGIDLALTDDEVELLCGAEFDSPLAFIGTLVALGGRMLFLNYNLADADLRLLLEYDGQAEWSKSMWKEIVSAVRGGDGRRTYTRWLQMTLATNGVDPRGSSLKDAANLANVFVAQGRAIPAGQWVEDAINKRRRAEFDRMF